LVEDGFVVVEVGDGEAGCLGHVSTSKCVRRVACLTKPNSMFNQMVNLGGLSGS
jgi:hypothetical protein